MAQNGPMAARPAVRGAMVLCWVQVIRPVEVQKRVTPVQEVSPQVFVSGLKASPVMTPVEISAGNAPVRSVKVSTEAGKVTCTKRLVSTPVETPPAANARSVVPLVDPIVAM